MKMKQEYVVYFMFTVSAFLGFSVECGRKKTLVTYNTALFENIDRNIAGGGPERSTRRDAIIQELNRTSADVVCLQEVYLGGDLQAIVDGLAGRFPYSMSSLHNTGGTIESSSGDPACPTAEFTTFATCLQTNCSAVSSYNTIAELAACILANCSAEIFVLPQKCWTCFAVAGPDFTDIMQSCTGSVPAPYHTINLPGLLLLSRYPLLDTGYTDLHPGTREIFEVGYLEAKIRQIGQIVCTHTTYNGGDTYYEFELQAAGISNWEEQSQLELTTLVERFSGMKRVFLLGDFNLGPGAPTSGILPYWPENYPILRNAFCIDPIQQCTFCNSTENVYNDASSRIIDLIFTKGYKPLRKKRIYDDVTVQNFPLSDHFGVMQEFVCKRHRRH